MMVGWYGIDVVVVVVVVVVIAARNVVDGVVVDALWSATLLSLN